MSWRNALNHAMDGLASAHSGEMLPWEEKCRVLGVDLTEETFVQPENKISKLSHGNRRVALMVDSNLTSTLVDYVIYTCHCLEAGLALLTSSSMLNVESILQPHLSRLAKANIIPYIVQMPSAGSAGLATYLDHHRDVIFVVAGTRNLDCRSLYESGKKRWHLFVPLVVVDEDLPLPKHSA